MTSELNTIDDMGMVLIPFNLIAAACSAIDKKRDASKTLAELRRYTVGDMSSPRAVPDVPELVRYRLHWSDYDSADMEVDNMEGEYVRYDHAAAIIAAKDEDLKWRNMNNAPMDGTIINALARYEGATAGFPTYIGYNQEQGCWLEYSKHAPAAMIPWAWRPRPFWPDEWEVK